MRVLGIDPGYAIVGWGVVDYAGNRFAPVDFGAVCTDAGVPFERRLDEVYITVNKNKVPGDPRSPFVTSGIRLGTPAVTSRGLGTADMDRIAEAIAVVIKGGEEKIPEARAIVKELTDKYPLI